MKICFSSTSALTKTQIQLCTRLASYKPQGWTLCSGRKGVVTASQQESSSSFPTCSYSVFRNKLIFGCIGKSFIREMFIHEWQEGMQEAISVRLHQFAHTTAVEKSIGPQNLRLDKTIESNFSDLLRQIEFLPVIAIIKPNAS